MARSGRPLKVPSELAFIDNYIDENDLDGIEWLINSHGVDCYDSYKRTFLILAASKGNISIIKHLIELGSNLNFQDKNGYTSLHFACQNSHPEVVDILIDSGCDINLRDVYGNPPIWTAIMNAKEDFSIVSTLLKHNADIITKNNHGKSPQNMWEIKFDSDINSLLNK
ncbi:ankyrin repeat domain-containing protein [Winogradskyella pulchriflava]|uniref:Ankyrin repeat domain-containing protein n=1 Tax=Winogradskyella pulchriflava TaxID=1110688 RepID=A0ABV6Q6R0_9FLAO